MDTKELSKELKKIPAYRLQEALADALRSINLGNDYNPWVGISGAFKDIGGDYDTWKEWSDVQCNGKEPVTRSKWDHLPHSATGNCGAFINALSQSGWDPTPFTENGGAATWQSSKRSAAPSAKPSAKPASQQPQKSKQQEILAAESFLEAVRKNDPEPAYRYMESRGINRDTCKRFNVGYYEKAGKGYAIFPYGNGSAFYNGRCITEKEFIKPGGSGWQILFNAGALTLNDGVVFMMESETDAMSVAQAGFAAVSGVATKLQEAITATGTTAREFVIIADPDPSGRTQAEKTKKILAELEYPSAIITLPAPYKDPNAFLAADPQGFQEWITKSERANEEEYHALTAAGRMAAFEEYIETRPEPISTGFALLDQALDGGLYNELHVIGAISSLGKTALTMQIADQIAAAGKDVIIFSLEMSAFELMSRSISRLTTKASSNPAQWQRQHAIEEGSRSKVYAAVETTINAAKAIYKSLADHLVIIEGRRFNVMQIREAVAKHVKIRQTKPVIIVDYLQILKPIPGHERDTEKMQMDDAIDELKYISTDFQVPVIAISSFNRDNYTEPVSMRSFKESGGIEYGTGVLIGMQFSAVRGDLQEDGKRKRPRDTKDWKPDIDKERAQPQRSVDLVILKQRAGATGKTIEMKFNAAYSAFTEERIVTPYGPKDDPPERGEREI